MNPPSKGSSADFPGFASALIEKALGDGALAFFVQGCGGDINPVRYKEVNRPPDAEPLGNLLGLSVLAGDAKDHGSPGRRAGGETTRSSPCRGRPITSGGSTRSKPSGPGS